MTSRPSPLSLPSTSQRQRPLPARASSFVSTLLFVSCLLFSALGCAPITNIDHTEQADSFNAEESRVDHALQSLAATGVRLPTDLSFTPVADAFHDNPDSGTSERVLAEARRIGEQLWQRAVINAHPAQDTLDDRPLYWQRLLEKRSFRQRCGAAEFCEQALHTFEWASRGATDLQFEPRSDLRILVSGFDPFSLDRHIDQSNPSGAAALALDGWLITANSKTAELQSVLFPVRFEDFDNGMVEAVFEPFITDTKKPIDMLITISMGRSGFDLERYPGRRRSATAPDNLGVKTGADASRPAIPLLNGQPLAGPEFVEFSLPVAAMTKIQSPYPVTDNHNVATLENGGFAATTLLSLTGQTAVSGSGGGYLSNEISYRTVRLVRSHNRDIAVGHIHTPRIEAFNQDTIKLISNQVRAIIGEAVRALADQTP